ncbi:MAG: M48 family metallopeptidase [Bacteroidota bacterium]
MQAKYFDGQSSKAHQVSIKETHEGIHITSADLSGEIDTHWHKALIKTESFATGNKVLLVYGDEFPPQRLEITGGLADEFMRSILQHESKIKTFQFMITRMNPVKLVVASLAVIALVIVAYVGFISPYVGEQAVKLLPKSFEEEYGARAYETISTFTDIDEEKSELLMDFYDAVGYSSDYNIRIDYADEGVKNAFAVPGGQMVFYRGLIEEMESWEALAAVMGHELAHVNKRHSFKAVARTLSNFMIISVLTGDVGGVSSVFLENAHTFSEMAYSRSHEKEADLVGLQYMTEQQIDPKGMIELFEILLSEHEIEHEETSKVIEFMSTHPLTQKRIDYIKAEIDKTRDQEDYKENAEAARIFEQLKK